MTDINTTETLINVKIPGKFQISRDPDPETGNIISRDPEPIFSGTGNLQTAMQIVLWWVFI